MIITASSLRQNIYKLLDSIIYSGKPLEIKRKGKILKIIPPEKGNDLTKLKKHKIFKNFASVEEAFIIGKYFG